MEDVKHQWDPLQSPSFRPRGNFEHRGRGAISEDARREEGGKLPEGGESVVRSTTRLARTHT